MHLECTYGAFLSSLKSDGILLIFIEWLFLPLLRQVLMWALPLLWRGPRRWIAVLKCEQRVDEWVLSQGVLLTMGMSPSPGGSTRPAALSAVAHHLSGDSLFPFPGAAAFFLWFSLPGRSLSLPQAASGSPTPHCPDISSPVVFVFTALCNSTLQWLERNPGPSSTQGSTPGLCSELLRLGFVSRTPPYCEPSLHWEVGQQLPPCCLLTLPPASWFHRRSGHPFRGELLSN